MPELKPEISSADFNFLLDFSQTPEISSSNFLVKTPRQILVRSCFCCFVLFSLFRESCFGDFLVKS